MKCTICRSDAEFIFSGNSLCEKHYNEKIGTMISKRQEYDNLLSEYRGDKILLYRLFKIVEESQKVKMGYITRNSFISQINDYIKNHNIEFNIINKAIRNTYLTKELNVGYFIASIKRNEVKKDSEQYTDPIIAEILENDRKKLDKSN